MKYQHLAENACGLGCGKRRMALKISLISREILMNSVTELMGYGHNIAEFSCVVYEHIRMNTRHGAVAERSPALSHSQFGINPSLFKKLSCNLSHSGRKMTEGF